MVDTVNNANVGEWIEIEHKIYSHISFVEDSDGYSFECRSRRTGRMIYPTKGKSQWSEIRYWKTLAGAKGYAIKFLTEGW